MILVRIINPVTKPNIRDPAGQLFKFAGDVVCRFQVVVLTADNFSTFWTPTAHHGASALRIKVLGTQRRTKKLRDITSAIV